MAKKNAPYQNTDQELEGYFNSLPPYLQETIKQCGVRLEYTEHLKSLVKNLEERGITS